MEINGNGQASAIMQHGLHVNDFMTLILQSICVSVAWIVLVCYITQGGLSISVFEAAWLPDGLEVNKCRVVYWAPMPTQVTA